MGVSPSLVAASLEAQLKEFLGIHLLCKTQTNLTDKLEKSFLEQIKIGIRCRMSKGFYLQGPPYADVIQEFLVSSLLFLFQQFQKHLKCLLTYS